MAKFKVGDRVRIINGGCGSVDAYSESEHMYHLAGTSTWYPEGNIVLDKLNRKAIRKRLRELAAEYGNESDGFIRHFPGHNIAEQLDALADEI